MVWNSPILFLSKQQTERPRTLVVWSIRAQRILFVGSESVCKWNVKMAQFDIQAFYSALRNSANVPKSNSLAKPVQQRLGRARVICSKISSTDKTHSCMLKLPQQERVPVSVSNTLQTLNEHRNEGTVKSPANGQLCPLHRPPRLRGRTRALAAPARCSS